MSETPKIEITITGKAGTGKTSLAWLLADFLQHTGFFDVQINSIDLGDNLNVDFLNSIPDRLDTIINRDTTIVITETQSPRL